MELVNPAAARLFGYAIEEMQGENVSLLMPEPHHSRHDRYLQDYLRTGQARIIGIGREVLGRKKDGATFPIRLSISEVKLPGRRLFTGIVHDLTEQKAAERALEQEKKRAQRYLDVANTTIVVVDVEGRIQMINKQGGALLGHTEEEIKGSHWFDRFIPDDQRATARKIHDLLMAGKTEAADYFESEVVNKAGDRRLIAWRNALIRDDEGRIEASISSGVDITDQRAAEDRIIRLNAELEARVEERTEELASAVNQLLNINKKLEYEIQERKAAEEALRKSEQELRRAYEKEKELSELKSRFVSMASHEFRTPLSTILSSADLIDAYLREDQQAKREKHTRRIKSAVATLTGILNDFLSLSKLEDGRIQAAPVDFSLHAFCNEVLEEIEGLLKPGQRVELQHPPREVRLRLDKKILKNILFNLLSNAIKYSGPNQPIGCAVDMEEEGMLRIAISDRGIGIPADEQQHLFTQFFRARNVENIQGTGLGLNIVKRYVEIMQGDVAFESELHVGSTFYVNLPVKIIEWH